VRLVHLADLHLGYRQYHRLTASGLNQREADVAGTFVRALDQVIALKPDVIVVAGDVFHTVRPGNPAIIHAFVQLGRLREALPDTLIVMIAGNHDQPRASETGSILALFKQLGIRVVREGAEMLRFADRDLEILAVPDKSGPLPVLLPEGNAAARVLLLHGEIEDVMPQWKARSERAALGIPRSALHPERWSYIALGHYHVHRSIAPNAWYAGSLDYTSVNVWGELAEERALGLPGKGFVEVDLDSGKTTFHYVHSSRRLLDLPPVQGSGRTAAQVDEAIQAAVAKAPGGIDDCIVRLLIRDAPPHLVRELDHRALRELKRRAMHFQLDTRRSEPARLQISGAATRRPTLPETVRGYLERRPLDSAIPCAVLFALGLHFLVAADAAAAAGSRAEVA
jgi:DNA repair exonuclease SbcCD nuclease subunit